MTWAKLDDNLLDEPDMIALPRDVRLVHVEALAWCSRHLTDGHIPTAALRRLTDNDDPQAAAELLVDAGYWEPTDDGWHIVDYLDVQSSREQVEERRAQAAKRKERSRKHKKGDHSMCDPRWCPSLKESRRDERRTSQDSDPTHSDPTLREGRSGEGESRAGPDSAGATSGLPRFPRGRKPTVHVTGGA